MNTYRTPSLWQRIRFHIGRIDIERVFATVGLSVTVGASAAWIGWIVSGWQQ